MISRFYKYVSVFLLAFTFIIGGITQTASAQSNANIELIRQLQAQITQLMQMLEALQRGGGSSTVAPGNKCLDKNVQFGDRDANTNGDVSKLQSFLAERYNLNRADYVTGYFGRSTRTFLTRFQTEQGLSPSGWADERTLMRIGELLGGCNYFSESGYLRVTAPNGGEMWRLGEMQTITWAPYSYTPTKINPAGDVDVYLEDLNGNRVGKIMDLGKASLHTYFNIDNDQNPAKPGQYYVRVVNRVTGETDRSDAPFTLLPRYVNLTINGKIAVTLVDNEPITISLTTAAGINESSCTITGVRTRPGGSDAERRIVPNQGKDRYYASAPAKGTGTSVIAKCLDKFGQTITHAVGVMGDGMEVQPMLKILGPNGGETLLADKSHTIWFDQTGLSLVSIALYRDEKFYKWLGKDILVDTLLRPDSTYYFEPSGAMISAADIAQGSNDAFKIYITGIKMGGGGYLDDKSDSSFRVVRSETATTVPPTPCSGGLGCTPPPPAPVTQPTTPTPTGSISVITPCTVGLGKSTVENGANPWICDQTIAWTSSNASDVKLVITGDFPYTTATFPTGYTAGAGSSGSATFWVGGQVGGRYKATLYSGTTKLDEEYFTIAAPTANLNTLNQMAGVLQGLQSVLNMLR